MLASFSFKGFKNFSKTKRISLKWNQWNGLEIYNKNISLQCLFRINIFLCNVDLEQTYFFPRVYYSVVLFWLYFESTRHRAIQVSC